LWSQSADAVPPLFVDIPPSKSGISWVHTTLSRQDHYLPGNTCPGCAFLDFDNDGWMDISLSTAGRPIFGNRPNLFAMPSTKNNRDGTFTDVTEKAGLSGTQFGMGVAVGDL
jgi:hypothetical protein